MLQALHTSCTLALSQVWVALSACDGTHAVVYKLS